MRLGEKITKAMNTNFLDRLAAGEVIHADEIDSANPKDLAAAGILSEAPKASAKATAPLIPAPSLSRLILIERRPQGFVVSLEIKKSGGRQGVYVGEALSEDTARQLANAMRHYLTACHGEGWTIELVPESKTVTQ